MADVLPRAESAAEAQTIMMAPSAIRTRPPFFCSVRASLSTIAASIATISGITPGYSAPACAAGANSRPAFTRSTIGAPQPTEMAANPIQPSRSRAKPFFIKYGSKSTPAAPKRIAATSHGVRLVRMPSRDTTMKAAQMLTAERP